MAEVGIEIDVYRHTDPLTSVEVLNGRVAPSFLRELKGNGGGNISLNLRDPKIVADPTLIDYKNVLKFKVAGKVVGGMVIGKKKTVIIDEDTNTEGYLISGEGLRTWLSHASVRPLGGLKATSFESRSFNFASEQGSWYNPAQWVVPVNVSKWGDIPTSPWRYAPANWPDVPNAYWVWSQNSLAGAPVGDNFFRFEFDVAVANKYSLFLAADNQYSVYIDSQLIQTSDPTTTAHTEVERIDTDLEVGHHIIGIRVTNWGGPAALLAALFYYGDPAVPTSATLVSYTGITDGSWRVVGYPTSPPGWSPGEIMQTLLAEAEGRGVRFPLWLTPTFTLTKDSYGVDWDRSLDWTFDIGSSLESVVEKLEELVCDVWIDPDTFELNMATERGVDRSIFHYDVDGITPTSTPIIFEKGKNLGPSSIDGVSDLANSLLVSTADGWVEIDDTSSDSISKYGKIEAVLETGASKSVSEAVAEAVFEHKANPEEGASYEVFPTPGCVPLVDFEEGDWVLAPNDVGLGVKRHVMSISVEEDDAGNPRYFLEFDTIFQDDEDKIDVWLQKLGGGALGGQFANSGGGSSSPIGVPTVTPPKPPLVKLPLAPANLQVSSEGKWSVNGSEAFSEVSLVWDAVTANTDGTATVPAFYEVEGRLTDSTDDSYQRFSQTTTNSAVLSNPFHTGTDWTFRVRAMNTADAPGSYSDPKSHVTAAPDVPLVAPTAPGATSEKALLTVTWDGKLVGPKDPDPQFRYVYAKVATSLNGTYDRKGPAFLRDTRSIFISGLTPGTTYWIKLVAVDGLGILSPDSAAFNITLTGIDLADLGSDVGQALSDAQANAAAAASDAATASEAAGIAMLSASGKNTITRSTEDPFGVGVSGDVWWKYVDKRVIGQWVWSGIGQPNAESSSKRDSFGQIVTNLATNPSFETVTSGTDVIRTNLAQDPVGVHVNTDPREGWEQVYFDSDGTDVFVAESTEMGTSGYRRATVTGTSEGNVAWYHASGYWTPVTENTTYAMSTYVRTPSDNSDGDVASNLFAFFRDSSGSTIALSPGVFIATGDRVVLGPNFSRVTLLVTSPPGAVEMNWATETWRTSLVYFDPGYVIEATGLLFESGVSEIKPYFDGNTPDALGWSYEWGGTPDDSTSTVKASAVTVRTNLSPSPIADVAHWSSGFGTGGAGTRTIVTDARFPGGVANKVAWTTLPSATAGLFSAQTAATVVVGSTYMLSTHYTLENWPGFVPAFYAPGGTLSPVVVQDLGGGLFRLSAKWVSTSATIIQANLAPASLPPSLSATFSAGGAMVELSPVVQPFFSGNTPSAGDFDYAWTGTANASTSIQTASEVSGISSNTGAIAYQSSAWKKSGSKSLRITSASVGGSGNSAANHPISLTAGKTYTILSTMHMDAPQSAPVATYARSLRLPGASNMDGPQLLNITGDQEYRWVVTPTINYTTVQLWNGTLPGDSDVWWDDLLIVEGVYDGPYFDGNTPGAWWGIPGWTPMQINGSILANIDAGTITTGFLDVTNRIAAGSIDTPLLRASSVTADILAGGSVLTRHLSPDVGGELDISANDAINLLVGQIAGVDESQQGTAGSLANMQTYYKFGAGGATISSPGSVFELKLTNSEIQMLQNGNKVSYWNSGTMYVDSFVGESVVLGNHQLVKYGTGTVVRSLT